jgi:hypothetical protein
VSQPVEPPDQLGGLAPAPLTGIAADIRLERLQALMINRPPDCLTDETAGPLVAETLRGIAAEVTAVTGPTPTGDVRELAVWAVVLGAAASLEAALFPEQLLGDGARAEVLQRRYLGVLADLRRVVATTGTGGSAGGGAFSGVVHLGRGGWPV